MPLFWTEAGSGPPLVLLHGFPFDQSVWNNQQAALAPRYRVITPDLRGHGRSPGFSGPASIDALADDIIELLDHLGITAPVAVGGLSMGGYIALSLAARYPERLGALMLIDTRAAADSDEAAQNRLTLATRIDAEQSSEPVVQGSLPRLFAPGTYIQQPEVVESVRKIMQATNPGTLSACLRAMAHRVDRSDDLRLITAPTLVIAGDQDVISTPQEAHEIAGQIPNATVAIIPSAGHLACLENPNEVNKAIQSFLDHWMPAVSR